MTAANGFANILTVVSSCIAHGINPREYLVVVTQALLEGRTFAELLPDRIAISTDRTAPRAAPRAARADRRGSVLGRARAARRASAGSAYVTHLAPAMRLVGLGVGPR